MVVQIVEDDPDPEVTAEVHMRVRDTSDVIGDLLDTLDALGGVEIEPQGWVKTFYGWDLNVWEK